MVDSKPILRGVTPRMVIMVVALGLSLLAYFYPFETPEACDQPGLVMSACLGQPALAMVAVALGLMVVLKPGVIQ